MTITQVCKITVSLNVTENLFNEYQQLNHLQSNRGNSLVHVK